MTTNQKAIDSASRFYTSLHRLREFDSQRIRVVVQGQLQLTDEEKCFLGVHSRILGNIETLLELKEVQHFQAVASTSRTIFELAVDIRLLQIIPDAASKMIAGIEIEKLRAAENIVRFAKSEHVADLAVFQSYIDREGQRIRGESRRLWSKDALVLHWSDLKLDKRVALLDKNFKSAYHLYYPRLSWYAHSGLTGVANLNTTGLTHMCSQALWLAGDFYKEVLTAMIQQFKIYRTDGEILRQMSITAGLPFLPDDESSETHT